MSLCGYIYAVIRHRLNIEKDLIYLSNGADTTTTGFEHTFVSFLTLVFFIIVSILLLTLATIEYFVKKKKTIEQENIETKNPSIINIIHTTLILIGLWFPFSRLLITFLFLLLYPISEILSKIN